MVWTDLETAVFLYYRSRGMSTQNVATLMYYKCGQRRLPSPDSMQRKQDAFDGWDKHKGKWKFAETNAAILDYIGRDGMSWTAFLELTKFSRDDRDRLSDSNELMHIEGIKANRDPIVRQSASNTGAFRSGTTNDMRSTLDQQMPSIPAHHPTTMRVTSPRYSSAARSVEPRNTIYGMDPTSYPAVGRDYTNPSQGYEYPAVGRDYNNPNQGYGNPPSGYPVTARSAYEEPPQYSPYQQPQLRQGSRTSTGYPSGQYEQLVRSPSPPPLAPSGNRRRAHRTSPVRYESEERVPTGRQTKSTRYEPYPTGSNLSSGPYSSERVIAPRHAPLASSQGSIDWRTFQLGGRLPFVWRPTRWSAEDFDEFMYHYIKGMLIEDLNVLFTDAEGKGHGKEGARALAARCKKIIPAAEWAIVTAAREAAKKHNKEVKYAERERQWHLEDSRKKEARERDRRSYR